MRKVILKDINRDEIGDDLSKKIERENKHSINYSQSQTYQQPQTHQQPQSYNPFNQDIKYEFMLFAMNPLIGAIYQIFKLFSWIMYSIGYGIGRLIRFKRSRKSTRVIL
jgi:hypothetical protein